MVQLTKPKVIYRWIRCDRLGACEDTQRKMLVDRGNAMRVLKADRLY